MTRYYLYGLLILLVIFSNSIYSTKVSKTKHEFPQKHPFFSTISRNTKNLIDFLNQISLPIGDKEELIIDDFECFAKQIATKNPTCGYKNESKDLIVQYQINSTFLDIYFRFFDFKDFTLTLITKNFEFSHYKDFIKALVADEYKIILDAFLNDEIQDFIFCQKSLIVHYKNHQVRIFGLQRCMLNNTDQLVFENVKQIPKQKENFIGFIAQKEKGYRFSLPINDGDVIIYAPVDGVWGERTVLTLPLNECCYFPLSTLQGHINLKTLGLKIEKFVFMKEYRFSYRILILTNKQTLMCICDDLFVWWSDPWSLSRKELKRQSEISSIKGNKITDLHLDGTIILKNGMELSYVEAKKGKCVKNVVMISGYFGYTDGYLCKKEKSQANHILQEKKRFFQLCLVSLLIMSIISAIAFY